MTRLFGKTFAAKPRSEGSAQHAGKRLRSARMFAGLTQVQVAQRLGMQQSAVSRLENEADMRISTLRRYLEALGARVVVSAQFAASSFDNLESLCGDFESVDDDQFVLPIIGDDQFPARRDVIFSIKPHYSRKIEAGEKTVELRRRFPVNVPSGTIALIYSTSPTRALTGIAEIENVVVNTPEAIWREYAERACIEQDDFDSYFAGVDRAHAIKLRSARPLRRCLDLSELRERFSFEPPQSYLYAPPELREALKYECAQIPDRH